MKRGGGGGSGRRSRRARLQVLALAWLGGWVQAGQASGEPQAAASPAPRIERQEWRKAVDGEAPIRIIDVRNDHGDIRARFGAERQLEALAVIQRLGPEAERVGFTVERRGAVVALTVAYAPGRVRDADPDPPKAASDRLDLTLFVPEGVALAAQTLRGIVEARGLKSDVTARTLDGSVFVSTTGAVCARTAGGDITALLALAPGRAPLLFESQSGAVSIALPAESDLDVRAETGGPLGSDFELSARREGAGSRLAGMLGRGGRTLLVVSATGQVEIRQLPR